MPGAWYTRPLRGGSGVGVRVAVVDSGWAGEPRDPRVLAGIGVVDPEHCFALAGSRDDRDRTGHGTTCARLLLAVAPAAEVLPIRVFAASRETSVEALVRGLDVAVEQAARVVNLSLATVREDAVLPLYAACERAGRAGVIIVAATDNRSGWSYPAAFEPVISVRAASEEGAPALAYRSGDSVECVLGLRAPAWRHALGEDVRVSNSFAAPLVSGLVADVLERDPGADLARVRQWLARLARACRQVRRRPL